MTRMFMIWLTIAISAACTSCLSSEAFSCSGATGNQGFLVNTYVYAAADAPENVDMFNLSYLEDELDKLSIDEVVNVNRYFLEKKENSYQEPAIKDLVTVLTGYYQAPQTGSYQFDLEGSNGDKISLRIGSEKINDCSTAFSEFFSQNVTVDSVGSVSKAVDLMKDELYPIQVFYYSANGYHDFSLKVRLPNGEVLENFEDVHQLEDKELNLHITPMSLFSRRHDTQYSMSDVDADKVPICYGLPTKQGFHANVYQYPKNSKALEEDSFYRGGFKEMGALIGSTDGVVKTNIPLSPRNVYGVNIPDSTNFSVELTGYFLATKSGTYKFVMTGNDDGLGLQFGRALNSNCSGDFDSVLSETVTKNLYPNKVKGNLEVDLIAGQFYPMRLVYANSHALALLRIKVYAPGSILSQKLDNVFQFDTIDYDSAGSHIPHVPSNTKTPSASGAQATGDIANISEIPICFGVPTKEGFHANVYEYPKNSKALEDDSFYRGGFKEMGALIGSTDGVVKTNILLSPKNVYGVKIPDSTNFSVELTGYFLAAKSGTYKFVMTGNDDGLGLQFGRALNSSCTDDFDSMLSETVTKNLYPNKVKGNLEVDLIAGQFYPMRLVYANSHALALLRIKVYAPGSNIAQKLDNIFQLEIARINSDPEIPSPSTSFATHTTSGRSATLITSSSIASAQYTSGSRNASSVSPVVSETHSSERNVTSTPSSPIVSASYASGRNVTSIPSSSFKTATFSSEKNATWSPSVSNASATYTSGRNVTSIPSSSVKTTTFSSEMNVTSTPSSPIVPATYTSGRNVTSIPSSSFKTATFSSEKNATWSPSVSNAPATFTSERNVTSIPSSSYKTATFSSEKNSTWPPSVSNAPATYTSERNVTSIPSSSVKTATFSSEKNATWSPSVSSAPVTHASEINATSVTNSVKPTREFTTSLNDSKTTSPEDHASSTTMTRFTRTNSNKFTSITRYPNTTETSAASHISAGFAGVAVTSNN